MQPTNSLTYDGRATYDSNRVAWLDMEQECAGQIDVVVLSMLDALQAQIDALTDAARARAFDGSQYGRPPDPTDLD